MGQCCFFVVFFKNTNKVGFDHMYMTEKYEEEKMDKFLLT